MNHLLSTDDPYKPQGPVRGICGKKIRTPEIQFEFDDVHPGQKLDVSTLAVCRKCQLAEIKGRYLYAVAEQKKSRKAREE